MALSTEQLERIVGKTEAASTIEQTHPVMLPDGTYTTERRQGSRFPFGQRAKIRLERADQPADWNTVMLQDISLEGISFLCDQELPIETRLALCLKDQAGELTTIRCLVKRCEPGGFGRTSFTIGAKFQQIVPQKSQDALAAGDEAVDNSNDPFAISPSAGHGDDELASSSMNQAIHRAANILNPARWWSHLTREYDDFTATGTGSKLSKEMQTRIAQTMENYPAAAPQSLPEETVPSGQSSALPRRSSIFLHSDAAPPAASVEKPPLATEKPPVAVEDPIAAVEKPVSATPPPATVAQPAPPIEPPPAQVQAVDQPHAPTILDEYAQWAKRDLSEKRYVYMWAGELSVGSKSGESRVMVLLGAGEDGQIQLIALQAAATTGPASWKKLLLNVMRRGLIKPPKLAIGNRAIGFWVALADFARGTAKQYCWTHQVAHILSLLPKGMQRLAQKELQRIIGISKREEATQAIDLLIQDFGAEAPQAAACLQQEKDLMLTYYDFPAEHWPVLRNSNSINTMFQTDGAIKRDESLLLDEILAALFKQAQSAQSSCPKLPESQRLTEVLRGEQFIDGTKHAA